MTVHVAAGKIQIRLLCVGRIHSRQLLSACAILSWKLLKKYKKLYRSILARHIGKLKWKMEFQRHRQDHENKQIRPQQIGWNWLGMKRTRTGLFHENSMQCACKKGEVNIKINCWWLNFLLIGPKIKTKGWWHSVKHGYIHARNFQRRHTQTHGAPHCIMRTYWVSCDAYAEFDWDLHLAHQTCAETCPFLPWLSLVGFQELAAARMHTENHPEASLSFGCLRVGSAIVLKAIIPALMKPKPFDCSEVPANQEKRKTGNQENCGD